MGMARWTELGMAFVVPRGLAASLGASSHQFIVCALPSKWVGDGRFADISRIVQNKSIDKRQLARLMHQ